jgi:hypothetical protein
MNTEDKLNLSKLLSQNTDFVDHTLDIRRIKHSGLLIDSLRDIEKLKRSEKVLREEDPEKFIELCQLKAPIMYRLYTDLFNKLVKDELNLVILIKFIRILELIEQEQIDQHEGSAMVGKLLKELYVDSAVRRADHLDEKDSKESSKEPPREAKEIRWKQWKPLYTQ